MQNELLAENLELRERLAVLLDQARRNQEIMLRHQAFDLKLIGAGSFQELINTIFHTLTRTFELDCVTLSLFDPDYSIRRILADLHIDLTEFPHLFFLQQKPGFGALHDRPPIPALGRYIAGQHATLFPGKSAATPASVATVPLLRRRRLIGSLNLGSVEPGRFAPGMATDFLEHLASIIAASIENVINNELLKHAGLTDSLTGVHNRRYVELRLLEEIGRVRRQGQPLSCMYVDIDHFKRINDSIGHQGGDAVLCEIAARIKAELRLSDALGRFGGEEFVALLIDAEAGGALAIAERIRANIADRIIKVGNHELRVTVSIGVAALNVTEGGDNAEKLAQDLVARADRALYRAKESGRNRVIEAD
jgi:two-component system cell cycle response regulator